jgi:aryl-alcohol dehydrogenase-like predicted oxidoreductase
MESIVISRPLGKTGMQVSGLTMGCWEIGGLAWGPMPAPEAVDLVRAVADAGITAFDTAEAYGNGRSEVILGHALRDRRDEVVFITKTGYLPGVDGAQMLLDEQPRDYRPSSIRRACELSRQRLQTDYIDVYLLHDPPMEAVMHEEPFAELRRLQDRGEIRAWGVSSSPSVAAEAVRRWGAEVVETPFNAASSQAADELFPVAAATGAGVLARSPFASGNLILTAEQRRALYAGDWRHFHDPVQVAADAAVAERLEALADLRDEPVTDTAIKYVLGHSEVSTCIVGISAAAEIAPNVRASRRPHLNEPSRVQLTLAV